MKTTISFLLLLLLPSFAHAQTGEIKIPMEAERWMFEPGAAEFAEHEGVSAMTLPPGQDAVLKDLVFENGTITFDVALSADVPFTSFFFRRQDEDNGEVFYTRNYRIGDPTGFDAVQYTAGVQRVALWDLHPHYQAPAVLKADAWNRVKIVVSGERMRGLCQRHGRAGARCR